MKGKLIIREIDEFAPFQSEIHLGINGLNDFIIEVGTDLNKSYEEILKDANKELSDDFIDTLIELDNIGKAKKIYKKFKTNRNVFWQSIEYIAFEYGIETVFEFLKRNPLLSTKKIILSEEIELNMDAVNKIKNIFNGDVSNIYFKLPNNDGLIDFDEYYSTVLALDSLAEKINRYDFSPLEKIMYAYDIVRNKVYVAEDEKESTMVSRDLSSVLLGDKIVCLGYARVFNTLLEKVGINAKTTILKKKGTRDGHARSEIFVKDDKYQVEGLFYFDPTWDSKKNSTDISYLKSYRWFAKSKPEMDKLDDGKLTDIRFPYYSEDMIWKIEKKFKEKGVESIPEDYVKSLNYICRVYDKEPLINLLALVKMSPFYGKINMDKVIDEGLPLVESINTSISAEKLIEVLFNVRKVQHNEDPGLYSFTMDDFFQIILRSNWVFEDSTFESSLLSFASNEQKVKIIAYLLGEYSDRTGLQDRIKHSPQGNKLKNTKGNARRKTKN